MDKYGKQRLIQRMLEIVEMEKMEKMKKSIRKEIAIAITEESVEKEIQGIITTYSNLIADTISPERDFTQHEEEKEDTISVVKAVEDAIKNLELNKISLSTEAKQTLIKRVQEIETEAKQKFKELYLKKKTAGDIFPTHYDYIGRSQYHRDWVKDIMEKKSKDLRREINIKKYKDLHTAKSIVREIEIDLIAAFTVEFYMDEEERDRSLKRILYLSRQLSTGADRIEDAIRKMAG